MEDSFVIRSSIFNELKDPSLKTLNHSDYEQRIFAYLDSLQNRGDFNVLEAYSKKLHKLKDLEWLNVSRGLSIQDDLKGRLVLIDFWTYCCINCMHIIPLIKQLEHQFSELAVVGVHSSKFSNEKSKANIFSAMKRHLIKHPVVCDTNLDIWNDLQIICWPTLLILDPAGLVIGEFQGEVQANLIPKFLSACFKYYHKSLITTQLTVPYSLNKLEETKDTIFNATKLQFPTKLLVHGDMMFISDSGNNRIVVADPENGKVKFIIGSGRCGWLDSDFYQAQFDWPQGLAYDANACILYIADTFNDVIRAADLTSKTVRTVCGVCSKGQQTIGEYDFVGGKTSLEQAISSPWDLCLIEKDNSKILLIACAGTHQIWLYSFENTSRKELDDSKFSKLKWWKGLEFGWNSLSNIAGNGKECNKNNSYPLQASFAQPSGLDYDPNAKCVYLADAESSTIRVISLNDGAVKNIVGGDLLQPDNLFAYGDCEGKGGQAKLQHPLDVKFTQLKGQDSLVIADSYNNSVKVVNLATKYCQKMKLNGDNLNEPNCVFINKNKVWIVDTNNHQIKVIGDIASNEEIFQVEKFILNFDAVTSNDIDLTNLNLKDCIFLQLSDVNINFDAPNDWNMMVNGKDAYSGELKQTLSENGKHIYKLTSGLDLNSIEKIELKINCVYCVGEKSEGVCRMLEKKAIFERKEIELMKDNKDVDSSLSEAIVLKIE